MTTVDIPLLKEAKTFVRRLETAVQAYGESRHRSARRINWSYRYAKDFHAAEARVFAADPDAYLAGVTTPKPQVEDVFRQEVCRCKLAETLLKVSAHWGFALIGWGVDQFAGKPKGSIYRKCYVDDIENVFNQDEKDVVRFVFPFPLNAKRQWKYLSFLRQRRYPFRLAGYPYSLRDLLTLLHRHDVEALRRLETRAQLRLGRSIRSASNWQVMQLSDEFDIASLDLVGALKRRGIRIVNRAHGVGKYFPIQGYDEFHVLMRVQEDYYRSIRPCRFVLGSLSTSQPGVSSGETVTGARLQLVFVSQTSSRTGAYLEKCESEVLSALSNTFGGRKDVELLIKAHPNRASPLVVEGFHPLGALSDLGSAERTVFVSFYSSSHIDPAFKGRRFLLSYDMIRPGIAFDDAGTIVDLESLLQQIEALSPSPTPSLRASSEGH